MKIVRLLALVIFLQGCQGSKPSSEVKQPQTKDKAEPAAKVEPGKPEPVKAEPAVKPGAIPPEALLALEFPKGRLVITCPKQLGPNGAPKRLATDVDMANQPKADTGAMFRLRGYVYRLDHEIPGVKLSHVEIPGVAQDRSRRSVWSSEHQNCTITRDIQVVAGKKAGPLDTVQITYLIENKGKQPLTIALRDLINTHCGGKDDAPYEIPARGGKPAETITDLIEFGANDMPEAIRRSESKAAEALHSEFRPHLPGTDPPDKLVICQMPYGNGWGGTGRAGDWKYELIVPDKRFGSDGCIVIYWPEREVKPGEQRKLGYTYGLASR